MKRLRAHIFICTNERPKGHIRGCCKEKGSEELVQAFKQELAKYNVKKEVRAQKSGCLDICEYGPAVVIYPEGVWYGKVQLSDVPEIVQSHIISGKPVARLVLVDSVDSMDSF